MKTGNNKRKPKNICDVGLMLSPKRLKKLAKNVKANNLLLQRLETDDK